MKALVCTGADDGGLRWECFKDDATDLDGLSIQFPLIDEARRGCLIEVERLLRKNKITWLKPIGSPLGQWLLNSDGFVAMFETPEQQSWIAELGWLKGRFVVTPDHETRDIHYSHTDQVQRKSYVTFMLTRDEAQAQPIGATLSELKDCLTAFQRDHPEQNKTAFLMMNFADTPLHRRIRTAIRKICKKHGIRAVRADEKRYSDDLFPNVRTYMHGCGFGIAVIERLVKNDFNPNVSLEVGYMFALGRNVCLLKDSTLPSLQSDLVGRLYEEFDTQSPAKTIPPVLEKWLRDKGLNST